MKALKAFKISFKVEAFYKALKVLKNLKKRNYFETFELSMMKAFLFNEASKASDSYQDQALTKVHKKKL